MPKSARKPNTAKFRRVLRAYGFVRATPEAVALWDSECEKDLTDFLRLVKVGHSRITTKTSDVVAATKARGIKIIGNIEGSDPFHRKRKEASSENE